MTIFNHIQDYLTFQSSVRKVTEITHRDLNEDLTNWNDWLFNNNIIDPSHLTPEVLDDWTAYEQGRGIAVNTWNRKATSVRSFLRYCHGRGLIPIPLYDAIGRSKDQNPKLPKVLSPDQVKAVEEDTEAQNFRAARFMAIWGLMTYEGLRVGETHKLNMESLTSEQGITALDVMGKGMRRRLVYLSDKTINWVNSYLTARKQYLTWRNLSSNALLVSEQGKRLSIRMMQIMVKKTTHGQATPHTLRRTAVTECVNNLTDLAQLPLVADQFGHTIPIMQKHYLKPKALKILAIKNRVA